ncbi:HMGL-like family protein [Francisella philomiragia]|uniref:homocitrate synthase/isopropylmalate synthase family protein n=1 Tax=Francisella philomiragia TaxID=28110 RepID=UPI0005A57A0D|nr:alpha-isopropylmalate synthase regulatory domain-containing protein [Francisella philomiragia]AJI56207.1 HMGL-like family protein [Francisella philomiragia]MBK2024727.1 2-isopropylmalate synthase [Francisella philomiragia]
MDKKKIYIFDTTLRDGQQSPGAGMCFEDNIAYADLADKLNIDVLEAGFPSASNTDFEIVNTISKRMAEKNSNMIIAGLCQLRKNQVEITMDALRPSLAIGKARVHMYLPVDPNLAQASLGSKNDNEQNIKNVYELIKLASDQGFEVEFSAEGYSRLGDTFDYVTDVFRAAVSAGVTVINCPDTIGGACERENDNYFVKNMTKHAEIIKKEFPDKNIIWSAHCHNDLGLALENSMNAVFDGPATQVEGCINGVGERAGNASLEQCVMFINLFGKQKDCHFYNDINIANFKTISDFIGKRMLSRQPHHPITGLNSARHTSGGHTNAILNNPLAYQPFHPESVGNEISFIFGPLSGGNHAKKIIEENGYICDDKEKAAIAQQIKDIYHERRKGITDEELIQAYKQIKSPIHVSAIDYGKSNGETYVELKGRFFGNTDYRITDRGENSALSALLKGIQEYIPEVNISDYFSRSLKDAGINSKSETTIIIKTGENSPVVEGIAVDQDIEISSLKALITATNKLYIETNYRK